MFDTKESVLDDPPPVPLERLANARAEQERREQRDQAGEPVARDRVQVFEPEGWADRMRRYDDEHATRPRVPVLVPIPV